MHRRQTLQRLAQQDDLFLKERITTAEDEHTAMAKANKTDSRQKTINQAHNKTNTKPTTSITQRAQNTTYGICTAFKRTATQLLTNKKQVTFGNTIDIEQANTVHLTYDSGADGHYVSKDNRKRHACPSYAHQTKKLEWQMGTHARQRMSRNFPSHSYQNRQQQQTCSPTSPRH